MKDTTPTENAINRVEQAKRLIGKASRARLEAHTQLWPTQDEVDQVRQVSEAMADLSRLINGLHDSSDQHPETAESPARRRLGGSGEAKTSS